MKQVAKIENEKVEKLRVAWFGNVECFVSAKREVNRDWLRVRRCSSVKCFLLQKQADSRQKWAGLQYLVD